MEICLDGFRVWWGYVVGQPCSILSIHLSYGLPFCGYLITYIYVTLKTATILTGDSFLGSHFNFTSLLVPIQQDKKTTRLLFSEY